MRLIFLRHAETEYNKLGLSQGGEVDPVLNETGKKQSICTANYLKNNFNISRIYSSTMQRARSTAEIIREEINFSNEIFYNEKLKESSKKIKDEKEFNGLTKEEYKKIIGNRARAIFDNIVKENNEFSDILVVSHGAVIKSLIRNVTCVKDIETNVVTEVGNCTLTIFKIENEKITLEKSYNNSHLKDM